MTITELKDVLSRFEDGTKMQIKINVLDSNYNEINSTIEEIDRITFTDFLGVDENVVFLETTYISEEKE